MFSYYNKLLSFINKKILEKDFFTPFLEQLKQHLINIELLINFANRKLLIKKESLTFSLQKLQSEYDAKTIALNNKYRHIFATLNQEIKNLNNESQSVNNKFLLQRLQREKKVLQEFYYQKDKNCNKISELQNIFDQKLKNHTNKRYDKEIEIIVQLTQKNNVIDDMLAKLDEKKQVSEEQKNKIYHENLQNFYTTDFKLNQKNKNLLNQNHDILNVLETKETQSLNDLVQIYNFKLALYQKNITQNHKIYQQKLDFHDKEFDLINQNYETNKNAYQIDKKNFFYRLRPLPFIHNSVSLKSKKKLYQKIYRIELLYSQKITLWKKIFNFINTSHQKNIYFLNLEYKLIKEIYQKFRVQIQDIFHHEKQKQNLLFIQNQHHLQLQIKTVLNLHLQTKAIFDNEKDYQEIFFSYRQKILTLEKDKNNHYIEYYNHFLGNEQKHDIKTHHIILQMKREKIKLHFSYFKKISFLKQEISVLEDKIIMYDMSQKKDFMIRQKMAQQEKELFLKTMESQKSYIMYLQQKQVLSQTQTLKDMLSILEKDEADSQKQNLLLKEIIQSTKNFAFIYKNKFCLLEKVVITNFNSLIDNQLLIIMRNKFDLLLSSSRNQYQQQKQQIINEYNLIKQMVIFCDKILSFIIQKTKNNDNHFWHKNILDKFYQKITTQKENFNKKMQNLNHFKNKLTVQHQNYCDSLTSKYYQKINYIQYLQNNMITLWQHLSFGINNLVINPLIVIQKISSREFFNIFQSVVLILTENILIYQKNNQKYIDRIKFDLKKVNLLKSEFNKLFSITSNFINNAINPIAYREFVSRKNLFLRNIQKNHQQKKEELQQTIDSMKLELSLLNENLQDSLTHLNYQSRQYQKKIHYQLINLNSKVIFNFVQKEELFFDNKKIAIKRKSNAISKYFNFQKKILLKDFAKKEFQTTKNLFQIANQSNKNQKLSMQPLKKMKLKIKLEKNLFQFFLFWKKHKINHEINVSRKKNQQKIKLKVNSEISIV